MKKPGIKIPGFQPKTKPKYEKIFTRIKGTKKMIKTIDRIKLSDIDRMERHGKISQFKTWFNFLPAFLFAPKIAWLLETEFYSIINKGQSGHFADAIELAEVEYLVKLKIEVGELYATEILFSFLLGDLNELLFLRSRIKSRRLRKIVSKPDELKYACDKAKSLTGMSIQTLNDVVNFKDYVQMKVDRLNDFTSKRKSEQQSDEQGKHTHILTYVRKVLNFIEETGHDANKMFLSDFLDYNAMAIEKSESIKKLQQQKER